MRLFVALDIDEAVRERIARFAEDLRKFAPDARWVQQDSLHITLKFIGERAEQDVETIKQELAQLAGLSPHVAFKGYGFFPAPKSARVFWIGMEAGPELAALASAAEESLEKVGIPKEDRKFSPHLTLARSLGGSGSPRWRKGDRQGNTFRILQEKLATLPPLEFGSMTAHKFFLYRSQLSPKGSRYTKLASFVLG